MWLALPPANHQNPNVTRPLTSAPSGGKAIMQANMPTEQWSWMVTQLWTWMWSGLSWILDLQRLVFGFIFSGTPGLAVLKATLLLLPAAMLIVGMWAMM